MPYSIRYDPEADCVEAVFTDRVSIETIREAAPRVARLCEENDCHRFLNDMSGAVIDLTFSELFSSPEIMDSSKVTRSIKRALIVPADFNDARFLETVTRNRGHDLMVFRDRDEAKRWLFSRP